METIISQAGVFFKKALSLLSIQQNTVGFDVSDYALRCAYYDGKQWQLQALRLAPGILLDGRIKNKEAFHGALLELKSKVFGIKSGKKKVNAVVSLSSVNVYSQVFSLPLLTGDGLEKAVALNMRMVSPDDISKMYADWQVVGRDTATGQCDVLSVFIDRPVVDDMTGAMLDAGFVTMAIESKALILVKMLREKTGNTDKEKSYMVIHIDDAGIDFLIVRKGELYFEYMNPWRDLMDEKGRIPMEVFTAAIGKGVRQVTNFYGQHWPDSVSGIFIVASALYDEAKTAAAASASVPVVPYPLYFKNQGIPPNWLIAIGCGVRGIDFRKRKKEISLLSVSAEETYLREQFVGFMDFWKILIPVVFGFTIAVLAGVDIFLARVQTVSSMESVTALQDGSLPDITVALSSASQFNRSVMFIQTIENAADPKIPVVSALTDIAASSSGIMVASISFPSGGNALTFNGTANSEDQIFTFEKNLQGDPRFTGVNVPLASIQQQPGGIFSFTMTLARVK